MAQFEPLVRPFESPSVTSLPGVQTIPALTPDPILIVSGSGQSKSGGFSWSWSIQRYADSKQYEAAQATATD